MTSPLPDSTLSAAIRRDAIRSYRELRDRFLAAEAKADAAFLRWFEKRQAGVPTNGAQANRLAADANYLSADLASAVDALYRLDIDPRSIDAADGVVSAL
jgi:hypothetical protein